MVKLSCKTYGFDCKFNISGHTFDVIKKFQEHSINVHGIEYTDESLMQLLLRIKK